MNGISSVPYGIESWLLINYNPICSMMKNPMIQCHEKIINQEPWVKSSRGWIPGPQKIRWWCCRSAWKTTKPTRKQTRQFLLLIFGWNQIFENQVHINSLLLILHSTGGIKLQGLTAYIYIHIHILDKQHASQVSSSLQGPMGLIFQKKCHEIYPLVI